MGDDDEEQHRVLYQEGAAEFVMMSSPRRGKAVFGRDLWSQLARTKNSWMPIDRGFSQRILHEVYGCAERSAPTSPIYVKEPPEHLPGPQGDEVHDDLVTASRLLHRLGGIQLVIIGSLQQ